LIINTREIQRLIEELKLKDPLSIIMQEIRELFSERYGSFENSIGVFGRYNSTIQTAEGDIDGESLITKLGEAFAKEGFISITGKGIFFKKGKTVTRCEFLQSKVNEKCLSSKESLWDFSRCLAAIPSYALFLLTPERSSSQKEEEEFLKNRFGTSNLSFGALFLAGPEGCELLSDKGGYHECKNTNFKACKKYRCPFICQGRMAAGDMENFIKGEYSVLFVVYSQKALPGIVVGVIKEFKSRSKIID